MEITVRQVLAKELVHSLHDGSLLFSPAWTVQRKKLVTESVVRYLTPLPFLQHHGNVGFNLRGDNNNKSFVRKEFPVFRNMLAPQTIGALALHSDPGWLTVVGLCFTTDIVNRWLRANVISCPCASYAFRVIRHGIMDRNRVLFASVVRLLKMNRRISLEEKVCILKHLIDSYIGQVEGYWKL